MKLRKVEELAKAELAAAIASEKTSQIEKMTEANLHVSRLRRDKQLLSLNICSNLLLVYIPLIWKKKGSMKVLTL